MVPIPRWLGMPARDFEAEPLGSRAGWKAGLQPPGSWYAYALGPSVDLNIDRVLADGSRVALFIRCPVCRRTMTVVHAIAADGKLSPSIVCPFEKDGCTWHVFARLEGWDGGALPAVR